MKPYLSTRSDPNVCWTVTPADGASPPVEIAPATGQLTLSADGGGAYTVRATSKDNPNCYGEITLYAVELKLITPAGDPVNAPSTYGAGQNEFTYSLATPGVLTMTLIAQVIPRGYAALIPHMCQFTVDPIGSSVMEWSASNPNGMATESGGYVFATVTFTGLPAHNSDFGTKTAAVYFQGVKQDENDYEVFFPKGGDNHPPCPTCPDCPNWFYFWKEGNVCGIPTTCVYDGTETGYGYTIPKQDSIIRLCWEAARNNYAMTYSAATNYGNITVGGYGQGIRCIAETVQHEQEHIDIYQKFKHLLNSTDDSDGDLIPNAFESTYRGIATDPNNPNTYQIQNYPTKGDHEVRCQRVEEVLTISIYPERDWANPGCQSYNQFGPQVIQ